MKTKIVLFAAMLTAFVSSGQTNDPIVQVKFYSDKGATNKITYLQKGPIQTLDANVKGTYPNSDRLFVAIMIPDKDEDGFLVHDYRGSIVMIESGKYIVLDGYPNTETLTLGEDIEFPARKIGTIRALKSDGSDSSRVAELWEYYTPPQPTLAQIAAAQEAIRVRKEREHQKYLIGQTNAMHWLLSQATNGSPSAQYSLGEHYLNGQGCESNLEQAIFWLQKSANQGDIDASNKLVLIRK